MRKCRLWWMTRWTPVDPEPTPEEIAAQEEMDALTAAQEAAMTAAWRRQWPAVAGAVDPVASA